MKKKKTKKKKVRHTVLQNREHSNFYTGLNTYYDLTHFAGSGSGGYICYLPDGTRYRKNGSKPHEE